MLQAIKNFLKVDFHDDRIYGFDIIRTTAIISVFIWSWRHDFTRKAK